MIGNPVNYDKKYNGAFPRYTAKLEQEVKRFLKLVPGKEVLDLGIGQGMNSIPLSKLGFNITGVDYSKKCLEICRQNCPELNLIQSDIRNFDIENNKYDFILSRCVLHFLHKDDSYKIIENIKNKIKQNGLVYIQVFSLEDPKYKEHSESPEFEILENNILHNTSNDTYVSFFTKDEILNLFKNFKTICISQEYSLDQDKDFSKCAGVIKYIGQKI